MDNQDEHGFTHEEDTQRTLAGTPLRHLTDAELLTAAQGCNELSCVYHGQLNRERARRRIEGSKDAAQHTEDH